MLRYTGSTACDQHYAPLAPYADNRISRRSGDDPAPEHFKWEARQQPLPEHEVVDRNPLVTKLGLLLDFERDEERALHRLCRNPRRLSADQIIVHEDVKSDYVGLILHGMAYRYKYLPSGQRQILGYLIPGDMFDPHFVIRNHPDHSVALLSDALVAMIPVDEVKNVTVRFPRIARAFLLATLLDGAILREWLLNVGQRDAFQRLSHFLCEISIRLTAIGMVDRDGSIAFPINQEMLADTTGLTPVHINRTLRRLRSEHLIVLQQRRLTIIDPEGLAKVADFDRNYLRIENKPDDAH